MYYYLILRLTNIYVNTCYICYFIREPEDTSYGSDKILDVAVSGCGRYVIAADDYKRLRVWDATDDWKVIADWSVYAALRLMASFSR